jgi:DNA repair protein RecN (Recombination protein N)
MLKYLRIQHIILVENEEIPFEQGLNVITGETGAGKSAIIDALGLIVGERADNDILRKGCDRGSVEAGFEIDRVHGVSTLLEQAGIEHQADDLLIIRRELSTTGKSRCFINNQMAQLTLLRQLGSLLIDRIGQHANQRLRQLESHRQILDLFSDAEELTSQVKAQWQISSGLRKKLHELISSEPQRLRDIEVCRMELEELQETRFKEGEEEELFAEYTLLNNAEERGSKVNDIISGLCGEKTSVLTLLNRHKSSLQSLSELDPSLVEPMQSYQNALLELQEVAYTLRNYQEQIDHNPHRLTAVNERLTLLNRLKRKYGGTVEEIITYRANAEAKLTLLENADVEIAELQQDLEAAEQKSNQLCEALTALRKKNATLFSEAVVTHLRALNMPKAEFDVQIEPQKRSEHGDDRIEFFLQPNVGENLIAIKECASGGELSRLMLTIQALLAGKEQTSTLIFDEIDSNIGGQAAVAVGQKLREICTDHHQVICITHFQQVASQADHHLQIYKCEEEGRTFTRVRPLDAANRKQELARMLGF